MSLDVYYEVFRSRNNGKFWSSISRDYPLNYDEAVEMLESEHRDHPSDWLKMVKVQNTTEIEYRGKNRYFNTI